MFGIGTTELLIVLVVALLVLGPKKLPEIARTLGKGLAEFKKVSTDVQRTINSEVEREEASQRKAKAEKELSARKAEAESMAKSDKSKAAEEAEATETADASNGGADDTPAKERTIDVEAEADAQAQAEMMDDKPAAPEKKA